MKRTLVVGFGNPYRRDDGVGAAIANGLLMRLGREPLAPLDEGFGRLGRLVDIIQLHQLVPELSDTVAGYDLLILVDAHSGSIEEGMAEKRLEPSFQAPLVAHQTQPSSILALSLQMHGSTPHGILLSIRGHDFGFGEGLSPQTAALVRGAVDRIMEIIQTTPAPPGRAE